jgi:hypothetical protein
MATLKFAKASTSDTDMTLFVGGVGGGGKAVFFRI